MKKRRNSDFDAKRRKVLKRQINVSAAHTDADETINRERKRGYFAGAGSKRFPLRVQVCIYSDNICASLHLRSEYDTM